MRTKGERLRRTAVRATPRLRARIDALARNAGMTRAAWLRAELVEAERRARTRPHERPGQGAIAWTLLTARQRDEDSVSLSTGLPQETLEGIQRLAGWARVATGAWIGAAIAEACARQESTLDAQGGEDGSKTSQ